MKNKSEPVFTCPWWLLFTFDNPLRKLVQDPNKILSPFVKPADRVLDVGCGMGYFTLELAKLVGENGKVIAADLQPQMLAGLEKRARRAGVQERIEPLLCATDKIGISEPIDLAFAFWMVHEVRDRRSFLEELYSQIKPGGLLFIVEPVIHVTRKNFNRTLDLCTEIGFTEIKHPPVFMSRSVVFLK